MLPAVHLSTTPTKYFSVFLREGKRESERRRHDTHNLTNHFQVLANDRNVENDSPIQNALQLWPKMLHSFLLLRLNVVKRLSFVILWFGIVWIENVVTFVWISVHKFPADVSEEKADPFQKFEGGKHRKSKEQTQGTTDVRQVTVPLQRHKIDHEIKLFSWLTHHCKHELKRRNVSHLKWLEKRN